MNEIRLYLAQRISAAIMAPLVLLHLGVMIYAIQGGLTAAEILSRTRGSLFWGAFYGLFVLAVAVHAAIGLRNILREWAPMSRRWLDGLSWVFALGCTAAGRARRLCGGARMRPHRRQPLYLAFLLHRLSGRRAGAVPAVAFLCARPRADGAAALDGCLRLDRGVRWSSSPNSGWCFCSRCICSAACACWRWSSCPGRRRQKTCAAVACAAAVLRRRRFSVERGLNCMIAHTVTTPTS